MGGSYDKGVKLSRRNARGEVADRAVDGSGATGVAGGSELTCISPRMKPGAAMRSGVGVESGVTAGSPTPGKRGGGGKLCMKPSRTSVPEVGMPEAPWRDSIVPFTWSLVGVRVPSTLDSSVWCFHFWFFQSPIKYAKTGKPSRS
jgi:hypothetical protein